MNFIQQNDMWRFLNETSTIRNQSPLYSFGMDDALCELVGKLKSPPIIRTWVHKAAVVLGIQDHRLPFIQEGMNRLQAHGYNPIVRNSGGLAVVLDEGILNLSLILSEEEQKLSINDGYELMLQLIRALFPEAHDKIEAYEIIGSYCPGSYDLSIDGKKFAGISQRRIRSGVAVQIYLCVEGSGSERAKLIRAFYETALNGQQTKFIYPNVQPEVMASLSELLQQNVTVEIVVDRLRQLFTKYSEVIESSALIEEEQPLFSYYYNRILERNEKMLNI